MFKKITLLAILAGTTSPHLFAQKDSIRVSTQQLEEVVIQSERVIHHTNYDVYMPSKLQKEHAANGLDLLSQIHLPGIRIDQVQKSINYTQGTGAVLVRINNVESTMEDLQAIHPSQLVKVEYTTVPSMKYGTGVAAVITVKTKHDDTGVAFGLNAMNAFTTDYNDDMAWLKLMKGKSELSVQYKFRLNDISQAYIDKKESFHYTDGRSKTRYTDGEYSGGNYRLDDFTLAYNYAQPERRVVDIKGGFSWSRFPERVLHQDITGSDALHMQTSSESDQKSTKLQVYYEEDFSEKDNMTVGIGMAYLDNTYNRGFVSPAISNLYDVYGKKYSLRADMDYTHIFNDKQRLTVGYQQIGAYTNNKYTNQETTEIGINNNSQYVFVEYTGQKGHLGYTLGLGASRDHFSQTANSYTFYSWRPKVYVQYTFNKQWQVLYRYQRVPHLPSLANLTSYQRQDDDLQLTVGNPNLRPYHTDRSSFAVDYQYKSTMVYLYGIYEYSRKLISDNPITESDGLFWRTMGNNNDFKHFESGIYIGQDFFNRRFNLYIEPKYSYDKIAGKLNQSNANFSIQMGCDAYYKAFNASLYYRSPIEMLYDDVLSRSYETSDFHLGYKHRALAVKVGLRNAFASNAFKRRKLSGLVPSTTVRGNRGFDNMAYVSFSWSFLKGHQRNSKRIKDIRTNMDSGIVK